MPTRWKDELLTGYAELDRQHRRLFELHGRIIAAQGNGDSKDAIEKHLFEFIDYFSRHYETENTFMDLNEYPDRAEHKAQHDEFAHMLGDIKKRYGKTGHSVLITLLLRETAGRWMVHHIRHYDIPMVRFLLKEGGPAPGR